MRLVLLGGVLLLLVVMTLPVSRLRTTVAAQTAKEGISESAARQIEALIAEKEARTPAQQKIDSQLIYANIMRTGQSIAAGVQTLEVGVIVERDGRTVVDITAVISDQLLAQLKKSRADVLVSTPRYDSLRALVPLEELETIAELPEVRFIQPKQEAVTRQKKPLSPVEVSSGSLPVSAGFPSRAQQVRTQLFDVLSQGGAASHGILPNGTLGVGSASSEGDTTHRASTARGTFNVTGAGIKIGVLSDGVTSLATAQALGDLGTVTVLPGQTGSGDEGTAMLEIIHDLAPDAQLYFATAFTSITSFAQNIRDLRTAGCDIIVDDVGYFVESAFQDGQLGTTNTNGGVVTQAVNDVVALGALYFSSAANSGNKNDSTSTTWEGDFVDGGTLAVVPGGGKVHDFDPSAAVAQFDLITIGGGTGVPINLSWSDQLGASSNDYDLFILNNAGTAVSVSSTNVQSGTQDPYEQVNTNNTTNRRVVIRQKTGAANRFLHLSLNGGLINFSTQGETHGHAAATGCYGVAATPAFTAFNFPPPATFGPYPNAHSGTDKVERFSSDGPRKFFFNGDGTAITPGDFSSTGGTIIQQPLITAADGVAVTGAGGFSNPFFGTSAAAPQAAAIAGLLKSANPGFTQAQIKTALTTTAIDIETAGTDRDGGFGIIMPYPALQSLGVSGKAFLELATATATESGCNNGNLMIEPGEGGTLNVTLNNPGQLNATGITSTLASATPGIIIGNGSSAYSDLTAVSGTAANTSAFTFSLDPSAAVDVVINFTLTVSYTGGWNPSQVINFTVATGRAPITTVLDTTAPVTTTSFPTAATGTQTNLVFPDDPPSTCAVPTAFPGTLSSTTPRFDSYTLTNLSASSVCATVTMTEDKAAAGAIEVVAYNGSFNPASVGTNYLADAGFIGVVFPGLPAVFSFNVPASGTIVIVVVELKSPANGFPSALNSTYTLKVAGLPVSLPSAPTITCPANVTQSADAGLCTAVVNYPAPTLSGGCGTISCTPAAGTAFAVGTTTVNCSVTGGSTCSFTVTVTDTQPPTITCPVNQSVDAGGATVVNYTTPTGADNCPGVTVNCVPASGSTFPVGTTTVTCTATDAASSTATCSFTVTVTISCVVTCPANVTQPADAGLCTALVNYPAPTTTGSCGTVTCSPASGTVFQKGVTTVTCTPSVTSSPCTFTVTIVDDQAPSFPSGCAANQTVNTEPGVCQATVSYITPTVADNCPGAVVNCLPASGTVFQKGVTTVTCTATDTATVPNTATCTFTVTVVDNQAPTLTCPAAISINSDPGVCTAVVTYSTPAASDNCTGATVSCVPASGGAFPKGVTTVTCTATDTATVPNTATCTFNVTVVDNQNPTLSACPGNQTVDTAAGQCQATVTYTNPTASDNCPGVGAVSCTPASGTSFQKGVTTVTCSVSDAVGQTASCSFTVTVVDNQAPTFPKGCPAGITAASGGSCAVVTYANPTISDNCPGATVVCSPSSGACFPNGTTTVTCTATDTATIPNTATCTFTVTVIPCTITCPANITVANDPNQCGAAVPFAPTFVPGCGTVTCSPASGSFFPKGTTTVTCATQSGPSCSFTVTVNDAQPPAITCPANQTVVTLLPGGTTTVVNYPAPVVTDNCPGASAVCVPPSGSTFALGVTTVSCTATDGSGNTATCSFTVSGFNACLEADSNQGTVLLWNTQTGAYKFCCGGTTYTGTGTVVKQGNIYTLKHNPLDRRVTATLDGSSNKGTASLQSPPGVSRCTITDRNLPNNTCTCL